MKKRFFMPVLALAITSLTMTSCKKDVPLTSETKEVATTKDGAVYTLDTAASKVDWKGYKVVKTESTSHFGTIMFENGEATVKDGKLESGKFVANVNTLSAEDLKDDAEQKGKLEGHLKSGDFFETEKFPTATYEITKVSATEGGDYNTLLDGNLTIKGITKPIQFKANVSVNAGELTIATEPLDVMREDFGVKFQMPIENGLLKNEVNLQIFIKANEAK
ncbi:YceI family protein [Frigoriflavimonas asaccharolytica]|uniref:Polyisoprenoid-binding protein YceI n=1 Tax=Frigoriflavimonas asaccharolytica TaxID=2735899 RepID=A0A8J8G966_9FLAO|nr:YceI family protein [Frigoriflavimonas asaccharolytica]NRS92990.1 polyisoprenoid-binding protein YceI [Frigoriflavimonas asaccharolytica]